MGKREGRKSLFIFEIPGREEEHSNNWKRANPALRAQGQILKQMLAKQHYEMRFP